MIELGNGNTYEAFSFPAGERHVRANLREGLVHVNFKFDGSDSIIDLLLFADCVKRSRVATLGVLIITYMPFGRQDRDATGNDSLSLKVFCDLVNGMNFMRVIVYDAHSPVTLALLNNCYEIPQHESLEKTIHRLRLDSFALVSPDAGAEKKIYKLAELTNPACVISCSKVRNVKTGKILETVVHYDDDPENMVAVIVDDICDGGRTFIEIAKELRTKGFQKVILVVSHGIFSKGMKVFDGIIDEVYTRTERVK